MTKRKTTAAELAKTNGQDGKLPGALPAGYTTLLADLKSRVRAALLRAVVSVNRELILFYWDIGRIIVEAQKTKGYGKQVVERLAEDLQKEFPAWRECLRLISGGCGLFILLTEIKPEFCHKLRQNHLRKNCHSL